MPIFDNKDKYLLRGKFVFLEPVEEWHRETLRILARDGRIWEYTKTLLIDETFDYQFDQYFNEALAEVSTGGQAFVIWSVSQEFREVPVGMTRLANVDNKDKRVEIGWTWYSPSVWGSGHNKECKFLLLRYIFETLKFNRAEFRMVHQNIRSQKAVEKIGGVREGFLRKTGYRKDGEIKNTVIYSIIDDEWPEKKERLRLLISQGAG